MRYSRFLSFVKQYDGELWIALGRPSIHEETWMIGGQYMPAYFWKKRYLELDNKEASLLGDAVRKTLGICYFSALLLVVSAAIIWG
jgi:hypothetical protein